MTLMHNHHNNTRTIWRMTKLFGSVRCVRGSVKTVSTSHGSGDSHDMSSMSRSTKPTVGVTRVPVTGEGEADMETGTEPCECL